MYSLEYSFPSLEPVCCSMSSSNCWLLDLHTDFSGGRSGIPISWRISQSLLCHQWSRSRCFLEPSCFFDDPVDFGSLISGFSAFPKTSLISWTFSIHILLKPSSKNFEHYFASVWDECNCAVVWAFSGIAFLWDWNENWPFPVLWPLLSFPNLLAYWV